jgi:hypothetical protein
VPVQHHGHQPCRYQIVHTAILRWRNMSSPNRHTEPP